MSYRAALTQAHTATQEVHRSSLDVDLFLDPDHYVRAYH